MSLPGFPRARRVRLAGGGQIALHARPGGEGPPLLLIHGFTDCAESYRLLLPHLPGGPVLIPDLPGHGASPPLSDMGLEAMADAMAALLAACGCGPVRVAGHSMGSLVAQHLASRHPARVLDLTLIAATLRPESPGLAALAGVIAALPEPLAADHPFFDDWHLSAASVPKAFLLRLAKSAAAMRRADWLACLDALRRADLTALAPGITCPVRLISGAEDPIFPPEHAQALARAFPAAETRVLAGTGHNPHWENPGLVAYLMGPDSKKAPR